MTKTISKVREELAATANQIREAAGLERGAAMNLGADAASIDTELLDLADRLNDTKGAFPAAPKSGSLYTLLIIVLIVSILFLVTLFVAQDNPNLSTLLVGQGTIFTALTALATYMARTHKASMTAYNERAAEWMRTDAIIRITREMARGQKLPPQTMLDLLKAFAAVYPPNERQSDT